MRTSPYKRGKVTTMRIWSFGIWKIRFVVHCTKHPDFSPLVLSRLFVRVVATLLTSGKSPGTSIDCTSSGLTTDIDVAEKEPVVILDSLGFRSIRPSEASVSIIEMAVDGLLTVSGRVLECELVVPLRKLEFRGDAVELAMEDGRSEAVVIETGVC